MRGNEKAPGLTEGQRTDLGMLGGGEDVAEDAVRNALRFRSGDVSVAHRGGNVRVTESLLHEREVRAVAQQVRSIAVLEYVRIQTALLDAR